MTNLDQHGQPINTSFNRERNRQKAVFSLQGILKGINADEKINEKEIIFLNTWLTTHSKIQDGDIQDLIYIIDQILEDGIITNKELEELTEVISTILEFGKKESGEIELYLNDLIGLLQGILSDDILNLKEFTFLEIWLNKTFKYFNDFPLDIIRKEIEKIKSDGKITEEELLSFIDVLREICNYKINGNIFEQESVSELFGQKISNFDHQGKIFCITGKFATGTRPYITEIIETHGGSVVSTVTNTTDVLLLGSIASRDWKFSSFGRKIENALYKQKSGQNIIILSEKDWIKFL
ncbi:BRCT domain-containing protein [Myxococcota bacterium]|nr:BRCT domain-containing protein [Myxococcota bacterium]MBU1381725.1 BRCT domain-containing protein [Myxococcota bacterium]MBU1497468.1 BRCT domain-containing protein [Myxococcota bacterium]